MIIEHATLAIKENVEAEFIQTINEASSILNNAKGYLSHKLLHNKEDQSHFILVVYWETLEHHIENFVGSPEFNQWKSILQPFLKSKPEVLHYKKI
ncbi:MAG TPA: antibiotic biosynthesis monooxygenase [Virgibacillus sp.]|nr:antibiotic biosynthesis monooxygenase [Virgibacillus sp.]HLR68381.1 antibiotic biosynthesis monooxygenase [Virgibacillus sp.]